MASTFRTHQRAFAGGEVTPEFFGQIADVKYQTGLATCRNCIVLPHGPVANRPGFQFVAQSKISGSAVRLIPFTFSTTQTMVIEAGHLYFRFHTNGGTLETSPGVPYEVVTPYQSSDLFDIHFVQSADVLTLVHTSHNPRELRRLGALSWSLSTISFASLLGIPTGLSATPSPSGSTTYYYVVTAVGERALDESLSSSSASCAGDLLASGAKNTISWSAVAGAVRYNVFKQSNGLYGYIGQTDTLGFVDDNIAADLSKTPPINNNPFSGAGNYPGAVSYYEQRRIFGGTLNAPQNIWMTRSGTESNMTYSLPSTDSDAISVRVAAREANTIRHIVPLSHLALLTASAEWRVTSVNSDAITPETISVKPQSYVGANQAQPVIVNNSMLYAAERGGHVREMAYNFDVGGFITGDLSLRAPHLFDGYDVVDMAFAKAPQPIAWATSTAGTLIGLTYVPEQQIGAWHHHDTAGGTFESVATVAEGDEDAVYVVVHRIIPALGGTVRYIERLSTRAFATLADSFFVDSGLSYVGAPATTLTGLDHLEGETVSVLADGAVHPQRVVTAGAISLEQAASKVHVGLPITADVRTLPLAVEIQGYGQGRPKNINEVFLRVHRSSGVFAGPDEDNLTEFKQRTNEPYGAPPALRTGEMALRVSPSWQDGAQILVRQTDPLPLTVVSLSLEVSIGG